jgi:hypothetical protein
LSSESQPIATTGASGPPPKLLQLCQGIAKAEGYGVPGALPTRCNNPGDLEIGDVGLGTEEGKTIFPSAVAGWNALYRECGLMLAGEQSAHRSHVYTLDMNFLQVAQKYTGNDDPAGWADNVARFCGVAATSTLGDFLEA